MEVLIGPRDTSTFRTRLRVLKTFQHHQESAEYFFGSSVVVDFLFIVTPIVDSVIFFCSVVRFFMSLLVLQSF